MPFPLAHPAAVLPLRRFCPMHFDLPALIIGSLCPDLGYCFGTPGLARFSHRALAGAFEFCLPLGLLLVGFFYLFRRLVIQFLPRRYETFFGPLSLRPAGTLLVIVCSLLIGIWTHTLLDAFSHRDGLFTGDIALLQKSIQILGHEFRVSDLLYILVTFIGAVYVGFVWLMYLERTLQSSKWAFPGCKWFSALVLGGLTVLISSANHSKPSKPWLVAIGAATCILVLAFFEASFWLLRFENRGPSETRRPDESRISGRKIESSSRQADRIAMGANSK